MAYARGSNPEARRTLLTLAATDFAGGDPVCRDPLAVLRNHQAGEQEVRHAVQLLITLRPRGGLGKTTRFRRRWSTRQSTS